MVILPLEKKLRKARDKTIALAQDILVMEIYNHFPKAIVHDGTAVWRCYGSNRFSEDVDFYFPLEAKKANMKVFLDSLKAKGFVTKNSKN
jgi:predicted nucleotidyltransferase component of viral defense system